MERMLKVLLVEDETITALFMKMELEKTGYHVIQIVATGEKAVISAKEDLPDIILMDIMLAGKIDGIEAASMINSDPDPGIPVIFCTAYEDDSIRERAEKLKPLGFLIKPFEIRKLNKIIDSYFL